ncbi:MAG: phosphoenolpyruvate carboxylase [Alphaproteobacteria bacterium]
MPRNNDKETAAAGKRAESGAAARKAGLRGAAGDFLAGFREPMVPMAAPCFPVDKTVDSAALHRELTEALDRIRRTAEGDPFTNPIQLLVLDISNRLYGGQISLSGVEALIQRLTFVAYVARAERLGRYLGGCDSAAGAQRVRELIHGLADRTNVVWGGTGTKGESGIVSFESFKQRVELELFGVVFTGHPTFGLSGDLMRSLAQLASGTGADGKPLGETERAEIFRQALLFEHKPDADLDLVREHALSLEAIRNMQGAMREVYRIVFEVADELYPGRAKELTPKLITVASWVGYDIDGRSDILWTDTFHKRLRVQEIQLRYYRGRVREIRDACEGAAIPADLKNTLELLESRISLSINEVGEEIEVFSSPEVREASGYERIRRIAKSMHKGLSRRLVGSEPLIELITHAITLTEDEGVARQLCLLRAELANYGLGMAHTHVRINASQLHNAIRRSVGLETSPDDPAYRTTYLKAIDDLISNVAPATINFGSILAERASAKRVFMIVAQVLKYVDSTTPIRFLIAECETAFTVLTALYFAKLFEVEDKTDISPLFETRKALERGDRVIEDLLANEHYRDYVKRRGRLCIQTGFSDSGRYMGQTAASVAIEQLRLKVGALLARHGLKGVQLLVFDTHGESIGRGGHPASMLDRLQYVSSPACHDLFIQKGLSFKEEVSFQGGDGYVPFMNAGTAFAAVAKIVENVLETPKAAKGDSFYSDADYVSEFFNTIKQFNAKVMDDANYAALLNAFGANMLFPSGSRALKRQGDIAAGPSVAAHPSQIRAIPHNAILQQLGMLANTLGGVGEAIRKDTVRFRTMYEESDRFHRLMGMVEYAFSFSDVDVFRAYIDTFDPGLWLLRAARTPVKSRGEEMRRLSEHLEDAALHEMLVKIFRVIQTDYLDIRGWRLTRDATGGIPGSRGRVLDKESRDNLLLLHALRIALIQEVFMLATRIPEFSLQTGTTRERVIAALLNLDVTRAVETLTQIFPRFGDVRISEDFGEAATYRSDETLGYEQEHDRIFLPLVRIYELIRRASSGITHIIGAFG